MSTGDTALMLCHVTCDAHLTKVGCPTQIVRGHFPPGSVPLVLPQVNLTQTSPAHAKTLLRILIRVVLLQLGGDPDASGRVGAIPEEEAKKMCVPASC